MRSASMDRFFCLSATLLSLSCSESEPQKQTESDTFSSDHSEPDEVKPEYARLIGEIGITGLILVQWEHERGFVVTGSAGVSSDDIASFREALDSLDRSPFQNAPFCEGILSIDLHDGRLVWSRIYDGRCMIDPERDEILVSPESLLDAFRLREDDAAEEP